MIGGGVDLNHAQPVQFGIQVVTSAAAAGEAGGKDHAVVGQGAGGNAMYFIGFAECFGDYGASDAAVGGD